MTAELQLLPIAIEVDGFKVTLYEVLRSRLITGESWYHVVVSIDYKGTRSRRYTLNVKDMKDLVRKLKIEITKLKMVEYSEGLSEVRRLIT